MPVALVDKRLSQRFFEQKLLCTCLAWRQVKPCLCTASQCCSLAKDASKISSMWLIGHTKALQATPTSSNNSLRCTLVIMQTCFSRAAVSFASTQGRDVPQSDVASRICCMAVRASRTACGRCSSSLARKVIGSPTTLRALSFSLPWQAVR